MSWRLKVALPVTTTVQTTGQRKSGRSALSPFKNFFFKIPQINKQKAEIKPINTNNELRVARRKEGGGKICEGEWETQASSYGISHENKSYSIRYIVNDTVIAL